MDLLDAQEIILRGLLSGSAILSIGGSSLICYQVVASQKTHQTLHRLLLGLSLADILTSVRLAVLPPLSYPFLSPSPGCTADGAITVLGYAGPYYNVSLSFYYLMTIRCAIRDEKIQKRYEPWFHGIPIVGALSACIVGLFLKVYNPSPFGLGCWINSYPSDCQGADCERGQAAAMFGLVAAVLPLLFVLGSLITNNLLIYRFVRNKEQQSTKYSMRSRHFSSSSEHNKPKQSGPRISQRVAAQSFLYVTAYFASCIFSLGLHFLGLATFTS